MADETDLEDVPAGDDEDLDAEDFDDLPEDGAGKRRLLIVIAAVLLLTLGGIAAAYFTGLLQPVIDLIVGEADEVPAEASAKVQKKAIFFPLEEMIVNLNTGGRKSSFLKVSVSLELENEEDVKRIERVMPRVLDNFHVYLRELRIEDLKGAAGMERLREELLYRVNAAAAPAKVNDILFKEMLVQ